MKNKCYVLSLILAIAGLGVCGSVARAEDPPVAKPENAPENRRAALQERLKKLSENLNLTDEQKEKLKPIIREQAVKMRELRQNTELSRQDKLAKFKELREDMDKKIEPILTPEQKEKWKKFELRRAKRQEKE
jgi:Spy/CpxP family protein refolding chaperone